MARRFCYHVVAQGVCRGNLFQHKEDSQPSGPITEGTAGRGIVILSYPQHGAARGWGRWEGGPRGITGSDGDPTVNRGNHGNLSTWQIELESSPLSQAAECLVCLCGGSRGIELGARRPHVYDRDILGPRS